MLQLGLWISSSSVFLLNKHLLSVSQDFCLTGCNEGRNSLCQYLFTFPGSLAVNKYALFTANCSDPALRAESTSFSSLPVSRVWYYSFFTNQVMKGSEILVMKEKKTKL